ncbi:hypothetical protein BZA70DRAFT_258593 [Myxozyma melibiosi]|uniref:Early meiotic induction protein 1 n=1 Tax=Myxozyma melibiosi TaxID=54550 RepID=A0ABR1F3D7_9ASCO
MALDSEGDTDLDQTIAKWIEEVDSGKAVSASNDEPAARMNNERLERVASQTFDFMKYLKPWNRSGQASTTDITNEQTSIASTGSKSTPELAPEDDISPADIYPTEMSCQQQFDELVKCHSVAGQTRHVYRYGTIRDCNDRWDMFKFCMGLKLKPEEEQAPLIRDYYKARTERILAHGSSEDVWQVRTSRHPPLFVNKDSNGN